MKFIALLRGVNVGGNRMVAMADLRAWLEKLGLQGPRTLLQSGSAVFESAGASSPALEKRLEAEAPKGLGLDAEFFVRSGPEWNAIIGRNPFPRMAKKDPARLVIVLFKRAVEAERLAALRAAIIGRETIETHAKEAYIMYPDGQGTSKLTPHLIARKLGQRGTARNWNTTLKLAALGLALACVAHAGPFVLVADQGERAVSLIDPDKAAQVALIPEGEITGHELAASPDGRFAYVPIYGSSGVGHPGTDGRVMLEIDLAARRITRRLDFGHGVRPHCVIYDRSSGHLYVTTELDQAVTIVDPKTFTVIGTVPTGQAESHMLALSHDGRLGYTANVGPGTVSVLDLTDRKTLAIIPVAEHVQRMSISADDRWVFTSDTGKPRLAVIDTQKRAVDRWIPLPAKGYGTRATEDGKWLLVAMPSANAVAVVDVASMSLARVIPVSRSPQEVLLTPDGSTAYVSCNVAKQVVAIDLSSWQVKATIDAAKGADGLAWAD